MQSVSVGQRKSRIIYHWKKKNLELCYQPTYKIENSIKIVYNNVCSMAKKWKAIVNNHNIQGCDIVILAETWLSTQDSNAYNIPDFKQMRVDSTVVQSHRELLTYLKKD